MPDVAVDGGRSNCLRCRLAFDPKPEKLYCSDRCARKASEMRRRWRRDIPNRPRSLVCVACRRRFSAPTVPGPRPEVCVPCRLMGSKWNPVTRAVRKGVAEVEAFWPAEIFYRDKWVCQICRSPVERQFRDSRHPRAPEVDHIIPLNPGPHTRENCQTACHQCNQLKGRRVYG